MATLTAAQKTTLRNDIIAKSQPGQPLQAAVAAQNWDAVALFYNTVGTSVVWKSNVTILATGQAFNGTEWAGMTSANHTRLQTVAQYLAAGYNAALADIRAMFNDIWSGAGGAATRVNLLALWKRFALEFERLYAPGGTDAVPATLVVEGSTTAQQISDVYNQVG